MHLFHLNIKGFSKADWFRPILSFFLKFFCILNVVVVLSHMVYLLKDLTHEDLLVDEPNDEDTNAYQGSIQTTNVT